MFSFPLAASFYRFFGLLHPMAHTVVSTPPPTAVTCLAAVGELSSFEPSNDGLPSPTARFILQAVLCPSTLKSKDKRPSTIVRQTSASSLASSDTTSFSSSRPESITTVDSDWEDTSKGFTWEYPISWEQLQRGIRTSDYAVTSSGLVVGTEHTPVVIIVTRPAERSTKWRESMAPNAYGIDFPAPSPQLLHPNFKSVMEKQEEEEIEALKSLEEGFTWGDGSDF